MMRELSVYRNATWCGELPLTGPGPPRTNAGRREAGQSMGRGWDGGQLAGPDLTLTPDGGLLLRLSLF
jgi:hypothetical protein